jgi:hypothetical protein
MYSSRIQVGKQKEEIKLPTHSTRMLGDDLRLIGILPGECRASVATTASIMHLLKRIHQARNLIFHLLSLSLFIKLGDSRYSRACLGSNLSLWCGKMSLRWHRAMKNVLPVKAPPFVSISQFGPTFSVMLSVLCAKRCSLITNISIHYIAKCKTEKALSL